MPVAWSQFGSRTETPTAAHSHRCHFPISRCAYRGRRAAVRVLPDRRRLPCATTALPKRVSRRPSEVDSKVLPHVISAQPRHATSVRRALRYWCPARQAWQVGQSGQSGMLASCGSIRRIRHGSSSSHAANHWTILRRSVLRRNRLWRRDRESERAASVRIGQHCRPQNELVELVVRMRVGIADHLQSAEGADGCTQSDVARPVVVVKHA